MLLRSNPFLTLVAVAATSAMAVRAADSADDALYPSYLAHIAAAEAALRLDEPQSARRWLDAAPAQYRGWEWRYLAAQLDQSLGTLGDPIGAGVFELAISPDGRSVAAACDGGLLVVRDALTGEQRLSIKAHDADAYRVAFSPDGELLASSGGDKVAKIWDARTGEQKAVFSGLATPVTGVAFSPDGKRIASCNYRRESVEGQDACVIGTVKIWDPATGSELASFSGGVKPLSTVRWSPDGERLAASSWGGAVYVWDVHSGEQISDLELPDEDVYNAVNCVAYSPDGAWLAAGSKDRTARVWDAGSGQLLATLRHGGWVTWTSFSPDGTRLATAALDDLIRLWDTRTWAPLGVLHGQRAGLSCTAFSPDGTRLLSSGDDGEIRVWDARWSAYGGVQRRETDACYAVPFSGDGRRLASCAFDGNVTVWDTSTWQQLRHWSAHPGSSANTVALSADGTRLMSCSWDKTVKIWNADTSELLLSIPHESGVYHAALSPDGKLVASPGESKDVLVWDARTGELLHRLEHGHAVSALAFDMRGLTLAASGQNGLTRLWYAGKGSALYDMLESDTIKLWSTGTGESLVLAGHDGTIEGLAFSPDGLHLATGGHDGHVALWDTLGHMVWKTRVANGPVYRVAFNANDGRLAAACERCVILDVRTGQEVLTLRPHQDSLWHLDFSPDGTQLATCSVDGTIVITDTVAVAEQERRRSNRETALHEFWQHLRESRSP